MVQARASGDELEAHSPARAYRALLILALLTGLALAMSPSGAAGDEHSDPELADVLAPMAPEEVPASPPPEDPPAETPPAEEPPAEEPPDQDPPAEEPPAEEPPAEEPPAEEPTTDGGEPTDPDDVAPSEVDGDEPAPPDDVPPGDLAPGEAPGDAPTVDVRQSEVQASQGTEGQRRRPTRGSVSRPLLQTGQLARDAAEPPTPTAPPDVAAPEVAPPEEPGAHAGGAGDGTPRRLAALDRRATRGGTAVPEEPGVPGFAFLTLVAAGMVWFEHRFQGRYPR